MKKEAEPGQVSRSVCKQSGVTLAAADFGGTSSIVMNLKTTATIIGASCCLAANLTAQPVNPASSRPETGSKDARLTMPGSPLGVAWGFLYGYMGVKAEQFMPQVRELGGGFTKIYLTWNQIEPQKGKYDWSALDAFVNQLKAPEDGLISLFSSSQWAVRRPAALLPPS